MAGKFVLEKASNGQYYFNLKAGNNETILTSEQYKAKSSAVNGIDSVKENAPLDERYEKKDGTSFRFNLKAKNGQVIGSSESYTTAAARDKGIASVKTNAPTATVTDKTESA